MIVFCKGLCAFWVALLTGRGGRTLPISFLLEKLGRPHCCKNRDDVLATIRPPWQQVASRKHTKLFCKKVMVHFLLEKVPTSLDGWARLPDDGEGSNLHHHLVEPGVEWLTSVWNYGSCAECDHNVQDKRQESKKNRGLAINPQRGLSQIATWSGLDNVPGWAIRQTQKSREIFGFARWQFDFVPRCHIRIGQLSTFIWTLDDLLSSMHFVVLLMTPWGEMQRLWGGCPEVRLMANFLALRSILEGMLLHPNTGQISLALSSCG